MDAFIDALLERLLATSMQTALLVAVVWALCRWVPRLSPGAQCWLWWLVALQGLVGLVAAPVRLAWLPQGDAVTEAVASAYAEAVPAVAAQFVGPANHAEPLWPLAVFMIWTCGLVVMGSSTLRSWWRVRGWLKDSLPCTDERLLQLVARASRAAGLRAAPRLRLSRHIGSPLVTGAVRPVLLLPTRTLLGATELDMALTHELAHLRRGDLWWGCVPALARHLFFFHPLAHLAVREYAIAREAGCDAAVVEAGRHKRHDYGGLLLRLGTRADSSSGLAVASPTFHALSRRLTMLQITSFLPRAGSLALVLLVAVLGVTPLRLVKAAAAGGDIQGVEPGRDSPVYAGERMAANFQDIPVRTLLQLIGETSGRNILIHDAVSGTITLHRDSVSWDQLLDSVLQMKGLEKRVQGDVIIVAPAGSFAAPAAPTPAASPGAAATPAADSAETERKALQARLEQLRAELAAYDRGAQFIRNTIAALEAGGDPQFQPGRFTNEELKAQVEALEARLREVQAKAPVAQSPTR